MSIYVNRPVCQCEREENKKWRWEGNREREREREREIGQKTVKIAETLTNTFF